MPVTRRRSRSTTTNSAGCWAPTSAARARRTNAHEGPVYVAAEHALYFTTVPEPGPKNIAIKRLQLGRVEFPFAAGALDTVRFPSNMANGMTLDRDGRLLICEQGTRETAARISRMDLKTRSVETVVADWRGHRFNAPNDVVVRSDRTVWFTDPNYGELQGFKGPAEVGTYVYRHDPATGETTVVADGFNKPNGLAFSPDEVRPLRHRHRRQPGARNVFPGLAASCARL